MLIVLVAAALVCVVGMVVILVVKNRRANSAGEPGFAGPVGFPPGPGMPAQAPPGQVPPLRPTPLPGAVELPPDLLGHVESELARGRKIQAIKLVRQHTLLGLKDAKDLVEGIEAGHTASGAQGSASAAPGPYGQVAYEGAWRPPVSGAGGMLSDRVRAFKQAGDHASAVALVRAETGMTAGEAERFVAAID